MDNHDEYFKLNKLVMRVYQTNSGRYLIAFSAFCISGLGFSYSFVENLVSGALIDYVPSAWDTNLVETVIAISSTKGLASIFIFVLTVISDGYWGPFKTIIFSTGLYFLGLIMLALSLGTSSIALFLVGAGLISIGKAVKKPVLRGFLADQFCQEHNKDIHGADNQVRKTNVWWRSACVIGVVSSIIYDFATNGRNLGLNVMVSAAVMGVAYCIFWFGFFFYFRRKPTKKSWSVILRVFQTTDSDRVEEDNEEEKHEIFKMIWLWAIFIVYSLVRVTGFTFFFVQLYYFKTIDNAGTPDSNDAQVPDGNALVSVSILLMIFDFANSGISFVCGLVISKMQLSEREKKDVALIKIICGMTCCVLCCITAYFVERGRLYFVLRHEPVEISIYLMIPQFIWLGLMTGLAENGLDDLQLYYIPKSWEVYGSTFNEVALGLLKFLNIPFVIACRRWIKHSVNTSRLDHYYFLLAGLRSLNLVLSLLVCSFYRDEVGLENIPIDVPETTIG